MFGQHSANQPRDLLRHQIQARLRILAARGEILLAFRQRIVQAAAIECHRQDLPLQILLRTEGQPLHRHGLQTRQILLQVLHLLLQRQHEHAAQTQAMRGLRGIARIETLQRHRIALVHQRIEHGDGLPGALLGSWSV